MPAYGSSVPNAITSPHNGPVSPHLTAPSTRLVIRIPPRLEQTVAHTKATVQENQIPSAASWLPVPEATPQSCEALQTPPGRSSGKQARSRQHNVATLKAVTQVIYSSARVRAKRNMIGMSGLALYTFC